MRQLDRPEDFAVRRQAGSSVGAEVDVNATVVQDRSGRGRRVRRVHTPGLVDGRNQHVVNELAGRLTQTDGVKRMSLIPRRSQPDLFALYDRRRKADSGCGYFPRYAFGLAPFERQSNRCRVPLAFRSAKLRLGIRRSDASHGHEKETEDDPRPAN